MDQNPSPLIIALANIADAREDQSYSDVMDLVDDLLIDLDPQLVKDWSIACAMHFVQDQVINKNHQLDAGDLRKFVIPALVQTWNLDYLDAIAINRLVLELSIHIWVRTIQPTLRVPRISDLGAKAQEGDGCVVRTQKPLVEPISLVPHSQELNQEALLAHQQLCQIALHW